MTAMQVSAAVERERHKLGRKTLTDFRKDLNEEISNICDAIKSQSRSVIEIGKRFFYRQIEMDLTSAYRLGEEVMVNNLQLADAQEGLNSFAEKRKPIWRHDFQKIFTI